MPTYEFRCPNGHEFDRFYKTISTAPAELECPECGASAGRQLSGGAGLLFKGSGFYLTDYGKNAHRKSAPEKTKADSGKAEAAPGDTGGGGAAKKEAKPDAGKTDSAPRAEGAKPKGPKPGPA